jgi:hypothetical protein
MGGIASGFWWLSLRALCRPCEGVPRPLQRSTALPTSQSWRWAVRLVPWHLRDPIAGSGFVSRSGPRPQVRCQLQPAHRARRRGGYIRSHRAPPSEPGCVQRQAMVIQALTHRRMVASGFYLSSRLKGENKSATASKPAPIPASTTPMPKATAPRCEASKSGKPMTTQTTARIVRRLRLHRIVSVFIAPLVCARAGCIVGAAGAPMVKLPGV